MTLKPFACWICGKLIDLTNCKTDEYGLPVHEDCYVIRTLLKLKDVAMTIKISVGKDHGNGRQSRISA